MSIKFLFFVMSVFLLISCASYSGTVIGKYERDAESFGYVTGAYRSGVYSPLFNRGYSEKKYCLELELLSGSYKRMYESVVVSDSVYNSSSRGDTVVFTWKDVLR